MMQAPDHLHDVDTNIGEERSTADDETSSGMTTVASNDATSSDAALTSVSDTSIKTPAASQMT